MYTINNLIVAIDNIKGKTGLMYMINNLSVAIDNIKEKRGLMYMINNLIVAIDNTKDKWGSCTARCEWLIVSLCSMHIMIVQLVTASWGSCTSYDRIVSTNSKGNGGVDA